MRFVTTILVDEPTFVTNISDLFIADSGGGKVLVSATYAGNGLTSFAISNAAVAAEWRSLWEYPAFFNHTGDVELAVVDHNGRQVVTLTGLGGGARFYLPFNADGSLGTLDYFYRSTQLPRELTSLGQLEIDGIRYLYAVQRGEVEFTLYREDTDGNLTQVDRSVMPLAPTMPDAELDSMMSVQVEGKTILISASGVGNFLASHRLDDQGQILRGDFLKIGRGTGFNVPNDLEAVTVAGNVYLIMTSAASSSITTVRVLPDGSMIPVDHVIDELTTRFQRATALATVEADGRAYVFVGGADGGISMFAVLPDGKLSHLDTIVDDNTMTLGNVSSIAAEKIGNQIVLFVASLRETGITQLVVDLGQAGMTIRVGAGSINGTDHDDILHAGRGTTQIRAGAGDDVLITGDEEISLWGGEGRDTFIPTPVAGRILIWDYDVAEDKLDLSQLGMIRSTWQLKIVPFPKGVRVRFGDTLIEIHSSDGGTISADLFTNLMFAITHYVPPDVATLIVGSLNDDFLRATRGGSEIYGMAGNDVLLGSAVEDLIDGGAGNDTINGGQGADTLSGGLGDDRLRGNDGDDVINGGDGHDMGIGEMGNDTINGHEGNDSLFGGLGDDLLIGGAGNDYITGDAGNDTLHGNEGDDSLSGGEGDDELLDFEGHNIMAGGPGNDTLSSGVGQDRLTGGTGADLISGGGGHDTIDAGADNDTVRGGWGYDVIFGGGGDDLVYAADGNDLVYGDLGKDSIYGEFGADTLYGGEDDDYIHGGLGVDLILGGVGDDLLQGGGDSDRIFGGVGNDSIYGEAGDDELIGGVGGNSIYGGTGNDMIQGDIGDELLNGDEGNDMVFGHGGNDSLNGGEGDDLLFGGSGHDLIAGGAQNDLMFGGNGDDVMTGDAGDDLLLGEAGNDRLDGGAGRDILQGGSGDDRLIGGADMDMLYGGLGADHFVFLSASESTLSAGDRILDFEQGADKIDLAALGLQFIGTQNFSGAGQLRLVANGDHSLLLGDIDGNGQAEFSIRIEGPIAITQDDLLL